MQNDNLTDDSSDSENSDSDDEEGKWSCSNSGAQHTNLSWLLVCDTIVVLSTRLSINFRIETQKWCSARHYSTIFISDTVVVLSTPL